jgi:cellulose synthase/poly-beta-1,6-N-acetylglucosamine synthase-like glycosyltransferase
MCQQFEFVLQHLQAARDADVSRAAHPETAMNFNKWIRQTHRWLSLAFTLSVIANFVAMIKGPPPAWITYSPLLPLFLLLFSGLYMFCLPYVANWRDARKRSVAAAGV